MSLVRKMLERSRAETGLRPGSAEPTEKPETGISWPTDEELEKVIADAQKDKVVKELLMTQRALDLLEDKFGCSRPMMALVQIKRKIKSGKVKEITAAKIRQWGK